MSDEDFACPDTPEELSSEPSSPPQQEASGDWRKTANQTRQFFVSLTESGFTAAESLELVKVVIRTAAEHGLSQGNG